MTYTRFTNSEYLTPDDVQAVTNPREYLGVGGSHGGGKSGEVVEIIYDTDPYAKALTGRTPERISDETGISVNEMFPSNARILYVGDPWQKMGLELDESHGTTLTLVDYEYGPVAAFIRNNERFRDSIREKGAYLLINLHNIQKHAIKELNPKEVSWLSDFVSMVEEADSLSNQAVSDSDYKEASNMWRKAREYIDSIYRDEINNVEQSSPEPGDSNTGRNGYNVLSSIRTSAWYDCKYGERGFTDIPDWRNIIEPKIRVLEQKLSSLPEDVRDEEIRKATKSYIEDIRLHKETKHSNVVEAVFPQLPFSNASFDRMVASWSISAHAFAELDESGFKVLWDETRRVLRTNGKAFIFPLNYHCDINDVAIPSLNEMLRLYPDMNYEIVQNKQGEDYTLVLTKSSPFN